MPATLLTTQPPDFWAVRRLCNPYSSPLEII
jgi:hypothetical protein